ncbi:MBL fold metallo-hydrolase [Noviherbaspirillum sp.]|uniref:MBL fold metallo-hydrolase n=1 Tax=Noviherbaspirillum sp. TaxID=1926288 RepID=UPI002B49CED1|nr:MBL fold metallo-hydrolase [Noviherbaspirillum sp.]HJV83394.1 MBL fold metallo-hydrolase [Noviherbaspirillum sp.]
MEPRIEAFFDSVTGTVSYVVYDRPGGRAAIIDPVLDYDPKSGRTRTSRADRLMQFVYAHSLTLDWILETHAHADHLSAAQYLKRHMDGKVAIGERICQVQAVFKRLFNLDDEFREDGSQFDHLFADNESFQVGALTGQALFVPGHTPADMAYRFGNAVFVGDTLFMPDVGTARCDFPGGDARTLYRSIRKLLSLPADTRLFMCHDYPPGARPPAWETSVGEQRARNIHIRDGISEEQFVDMRQKRDAGLDMPNLILPAIQVNIRAGNVPPPEGNGVSYLKIPLNAL